jgi:hypothetical protein
MQDTPAWKDKRMRTAPVYDGQYKITVKWCGCYGLPLHLEMIRPRFVLGVDFCQNREAPRNYKSSRGSLISKFRRFA